MKLTLSWLKDHLDTEASLDTVAETLTRIGLEVEGIEDKAEILVLSKTDTVDEETLEAASDALEAIGGRKPMRLSAATNSGVREALFAVWDAIRRDRGELVGEDDEPDAGDGDWTP